MSDVMRPYFCLSGAFDPDEITCLLEREPSWVKRAGDPGSPDALGPRLGAEWAWQPHDDDSDRVADQLAYLAGTLSLKKEEVADLSDRFWGTFHVFNQTDLEWFLSADLIRLLADLHINITCETVSVRRK